MGLNTVIYDFALAAHRQAYHKRLQWCIGKLDREIQPVHMFLFEHYSIRPQRDRSLNGENLTRNMSSESAGSLFISMKDEESYIIYQSNKRARYAVVLSLIPQWRERGGGYDTLPFKV